MFKKKASEDSKPLMVLEGSGGSVELWRTKVVIKHKGVVSKMAMGLTGDKDVYLSGITGIQLKKPTMMSKGYIQFQYMGSQDSKGGMLNAAQDENTVLFTGNGTYKQAQSMKAAIEQLVQQNRNQPSAGPAISVAEELAKLSELKNQGVISGKEFDAQKKRLLG